MPPSPLLGGLLSPGFWLPPLVCNAEIFKVKERAQLCTGKEGGLGKQVGGGRRCSLAWPWLDFTPC